MTLPWKARKQAARLADLRAERAAAEQAVAAAADRKNTQDYSRAIQRLTSATHAVMKAELRA